MNKFHHWEYYNKSHIPLLGLSGYIEYPQVKYQDKSLILHLSLRNKSHIHMNRNIGISHVASHGYITYFQLAI